MGEKINMNNPIDWRTVIITIKRTHKWPRKVIASRVGAAEATLRDWQAGKSEPRYSQGVELMRLSKAID